MKRARGLLSSTIANATRSRCLTDRPHPAVEALAAQCGAGLAGAYAEHVLARAVGDGARLLCVAEELAAIGTHRYAAHAEAGREDPARGAATRARELHALGQGGWPPPLRGIDAAAVELSAREAQLVSLAAGG